jgi:hypothetical protein
MTLLTGIIGIKEHFVIITIIIIYILFYDVWCLLVSELDFAEFKDNYLGMGVMRSIPYQFHLIIVEKTREILTPPRLEPGSLTALVKQEFLTNIHEYITNSMAYGICIHNVFQQSQFLVLTPISLRCLKYFLGSMESYA